MLFFLSPVIYPIDLVPDSYKSVYNMNPFVDLIMLWRQVLYTGEIQLDLMVYPLIVSCVLGIGAFFCFRYIGQRAVQWI